MASSIDAQGRIIGFRKLNRLYETHWNPNISALGQHQWVKLCQMKIVTLNYPALAADIANVSHTFTHYNDFLVWSMECEFKAWLHILINFKIKIASAGACIDLAPLCQVRQTSFCGVFYFFTIDKHFFSKMCGPVGVPKWMRVGETHTITFPVPKLIKRINSLRMACHRSTLDPASPCDSFLHGHKIRKPKRVRDEEREGNSTRMELSMLTSQERGNTRINPPTPNSKRLAGEWHQNAGKGIVLDLD